jgi:hypothetical protein
MLLIVAIILVIPVFVAVWNRKVKVDTDAVNYPTILEGKRGAIKDTIMIEIDLEHDYYRIIRNN